MRFADRNFLPERVLARHDSPTQRKFRALAPMPFGVVFLPWAGMTEDDMRRHFRLMKSLGFHNLKQTMPAPGWPTARILEVALEEGVIPFWYGEGGWETITPELLDRLGIPRDTPMPELRRDPRMLAHQHEVLKRRLSYGSLTAGALEGTVLQDAGFVKWEGDDLQLHNDPVLRDDAVPYFQKWCRQQYGTIDKLVAAWNQNEVGIAREPYASWEDFDADPAFARHNHREYGYLRDVLRFKADYAIARLHQRLELARQRDPEEPQRAGGEMGLFLPFAWRGTDMEGIAGTLAEHGSFYPSLHLAWHFEEVGYEVTRCIYMQSSISADWFKGGWSATWESTGGPQQFSGGKGWNPRAADETAGFTVDAGTMGQLLLSYLAGGFRGAGIWCWNFRRAGWEAGEYALLDRQDQPSPRALRAGRIAQAAERLRDELWAAVKQPLVGVLVDWDAEAIWAAVSEPNRTHFRHYPIRARVGASRALINANVPWEYVTAKDLRFGLADRYATIVLPAALALAADVLEILRDFAQRGGRVILDAPGGWFDDRGKVLETARGTTFEQLFGAEIADFQYSNNRPRTLRGQRLAGFVFEIRPTGAEVMETFSDTGEPAITRHRIGQGEGILLATAATEACFRPGATVLETVLTELAVGPWELPYRCDGALVYRLAAPAADHYFLMNDGPATVAHLHTPGFTYSGVEDAETGEKLPLAAPIALAAHDARWLRFTKG